jgi:hypothetical protein
LGGAEESMAQAEIVPEIDVLVAVALWLHERKLLPYQFSVAHGSGIDSPANQERLRLALKNAGVPEGAVHFEAHGPDACAVSRREWWQIECKGAGSGAPSTQRNNFDGALASAVSYFEDSAPTLEGDLAPLSEAQPHLGLALPLTHHYLRELKRRVREPLRRRLNLWVLLYESASRTIRPVAPHEPY